MDHLFSLDPVVDLFTNIKCLQANPFAVRFAAYYSRCATDSGKTRRGSEWETGLYLGSLRLLPVCYYSKAAFVTDCLNHLISGERITCQTVGMPFVFLLHCYIVVLVVLVVVV